MITATANLNFLRASARKVKLVIDTVRGRTTDQALTILSVTPQAVARPVAKLISSALANAKLKHAEVAAWYVSQIRVGQGPRLKRWTPRAQGRATPIHRPTCHITVVLSDTAPRAKRSGSR